MNFWSTLFVAIAIVVLAVVAGFCVVGPERIWALAGPADLGPVDFKTLARRKSPNDALACPPDLCTAKSDIAPPVFAVSGPELEATFTRVLASEPHVERVSSGETDFEARYIQRSRIMRFPDTVSVRFVDLGDGRSTLAIYSRSQLGESDLGVNLTRIERLLGKLAKEAPVIGTA